MKTCYLTIDDAPSVDFLDKCYLLREMAIPAVFFGIGRNLEKEYAAAVKAVKLGFPLGNHSYSHPHFSELTLAQAKQEISQTDEMIAAIYQEATGAQPPKWFRFPYGDKGDGTYGNHYHLFSRASQKKSGYIQHYLLELGYSRPHFINLTYEYFNQKKYRQEVDWQWTFDIMEWEIRAANDQAALEKVLHRLHAKHPRDIRRPYSLGRRWLASPSEEIILFHDQAKTTFCFETILKSLVNLRLHFKLPV